MKCYLVGGCVRDQLMGREQTDRDWVVVGSSEQELLKKGFKKVGAHFPVFLHPQTKEEYALARLERKQGQGYGGFVVHASAEVTLEDDLRRRDLTINAIAFDQQNQQYIDPFGGINDLNQHVLRHVSAAFADDPLRLVRLARFAATFAAMTIAPETEKMIAAIVSSQELFLLPAERVTLEIQKMYLNAQNTSRFWQLLHDWGALEQLFRKAAINQDRWQVIISYLVVTSLVPAPSRFLRAFAQLCYYAPSHESTAVISCLCLSKDEQKLIRLSSSWWHLISQGLPSNHDLVCFLIEHRLVHHPELCADLEPLLMPCDKKQFLHSVARFAKELALEPAHLWLQEYPVHERRQRLEHYYAEKAARYFTS
jgi:hypothetical protein